MGVCEVALRDSGRASLGRTLCFLNLLIAVLAETVLVFLLMSTPRWRRDQDLYGSQAVDSWYRLLLATSLTAGLLHLVGAKVCHDCGYWWSRARFQSSLLRWVLAVLVSTGLTAAAAGVTFTAPARLAAGLEGRLTAAMEGYRDNPSQKAFFDRLQQRGRCCGVWGHQDWTTTSWLRREDIPGRGPSYELNAAYDNMLQEDGSLLVKWAPWSCCDPEYGDLCNSVYELLPHPASNCASLRQKNSMLQADLPSDEQLEAIRPYIPPPPPTTTAPGEQVGAPSEESHSGGKQSKGKGKRKPAGKSKNTLKPKPASKHKKAPGPKKKKPGATRKRKKKPKPTKKKKPKAKSKSNKSRTSRKKVTRRPHVKTTRKTPPTKPPWKPPPDFPPQLFGFGPPKPKPTRRPGQATTEFRLKRPTFMSGGMGFGPPPFAKSWGPPSAGSGAKAPPPFNGFGPPPRNNGRRWKRHPVLTDTEIKIVAPSMDMQVNGHLSTNLNGNPAVVLRTEVTRNDPTTESVFRANHFNQDRNRTAQYLDAKKETNKSVEARRIRKNLPIWSSSGKTSQLLSGINPSATEYHVPKERFSQDFANEFRSVQSSYPGTLTTKSIIGINGTERTKVDRNEPHYISRHEQDVYGYKQANMLRKSLEKKNGEAVNREKKHGKHQQGYRHGGGFGSDEEYIASLQAKATEMIKLGAGPADSRRRPHEHLVDDKDLLSIQYRLLLEIADILHFHDLKSKAYVKVEGRQDSLNRQIRVNLTTKTATVATLQPVSSPLELHMKEEEKHTDIPFAQNQDADGRAKFRSYQFQTVQHASRIESKDASGTTRSSFAQTLDSRRVMPKVKLSNMTIATGLDTAVTPLNGELLPTPEPIIFLSKDITTVAPEASLRSSGIFKSSRQRRRAYWIVDKKPDPRAPVPPDPRYSLPDGPNKDFLFTAIHEFMTEYRNKYHDCDALLEKGKKILAKIEEVPGLPEAMQARVRDSSGYWTLYYVVNGITTTLDPTPYAKDIMRLIDRWRGQDFENTSPKEVAERVIRYFKPCIETIRPPLRPSRDCPPPWEPEPGWYLANFDDDEYTTEILRPTYNEMEVLLNMERTGTKAVVFTDFKKQRLKREIAKVKEEFEIMREYGVDDPWKMRYDILYCRLKQDPSDAFFESGCLAAAGARTAAVFGPLPFLLLAVATLQLLVAVLARYLQSANESAARHGDLRLTAYGCLLGQATVLPPEATDDSVAAIYTEEDELAEGGIKLTRPEERVKAQRPPPAASRRDRRDRRKPKRRKKNKRRKAKRKGKKKRKRRKRR